MLRTNLATRPFYNERLVHVVLGVAVALVAALTVFNVTRIISLSSRQAALSSEAGRNEARAADLGARAATIRRGIDPKALERVTDAAIEANALIDARTFSWTALFNDIEATLPPSVMLTSVRPNATKEGMSVRFVVLGRDIDAIDTFIERLEQTGHFKNVLTPTEQLTENGLFQTTIDAMYEQGSGKPLPATGGASRGASAGGAR